VTASPPPTTNAYLLQNRSNAYFATCELELTASTLRCRITSDTGWVAKRLGVDDLGRRLAVGERVYAFDFRRDQLNLKWLRQFFSAGFKVGAPDAEPWLVSLVNPAGPLSMLDAFFERGVHKQWRATLPNARRVGA
jgi:hypothetical protein